MKKTKRRDFLKATVGEKLDNLRVAWKPARMKGRKAKD